MITVNVYSSRAIGERGRAVTPVRHTFATRREAIGFIGGLGKSASYVRRFAQTYTVYAR